MTTGTTQSSPPYRVKHADGSWRTFEANGSRLQLADGAPLFMGVAHDITGRLQAEEQQRLLQAQLQQTQKMESLGSLAGGVAHDMNNVLGAILGLASASLESQPKDSPTRRALETIVKAAERGGKMVNSLLSFARKNPTEFRRLDVNALLREEIHLLERTTLARIRLVLDLAQDLRPIDGDAGALTHALMNLCVNAVDAMPENGTLTLQTRNLGRDWIEVLVVDTGAGMPKEVLEKALDPFFTTKGQGKGTGLGLSLAHSTVRAHRGQMDIHSEPGQGTRVELRFPVSSSAEQDTVGVPPLSQPASGEQLKVLLVDDDELIQDSIQTILGVMGHVGASARSGEEALNQLEAGYEPDVVILDVNMPGLGGAGTLPRLRAMRPALPVLLATGRADQAALDLVHSDPLVTLLPKPFGMRELKTHLDQWGARR
jgi:signal transduction histidine kinase